MKEMDKENYGKAFKEVYMILKSVGKEIQDKIPTNFLDFIEKNMDKDYFFMLDYSIPLEKQLFMDETLGIISLIWRDYLCTNEEREKIIQQDERNLKEIQNQIEKEYREKYNLDDIFKKKTSINQIEDLNEELDNMKMTEYKESMLKKLFNKIKNIFVMK